MKEIIFWKRHQNKKIEQQFFDRYAIQQEYDVLAPRAYARLLHKLHTVRAGLRGWQVELGCGTGAFTDYLVADTYRTIAIDLSYECVRKVKTNNRDVFPIQSDIEHLPFANSSLDFLLFSAVLHHFPVLTGVAAEAYRVLKPGSFGFAFDPNEHNPVMWLFRSHNSPVRSYKGRTSNERNLTRHELKTAFEKAGFINVRVESISGILYRHVDGQNYLTLALYNFFEMILEITRLENFIGSFLLTTFQKP